MNAGFSMPTKALRFERRRQPGGWRYVLQQEWAGDDGSREWRDVPVVDESNPSGGKAGQA